MMARTKPIRRSYGAGEWGRNRVRVFPDPKTGLFQIEWRDNGRRLTRSLKHRDWRRAKRQADEFAAGYLGPELHRKAEAEPEPLTLETLFDIYGEEVTPAKVERVRHRDRTATRMFLDFLGRDRRPETLSQRDWDRFIRERRSGRVGPSGKPVANRMIECDLKFLLAVLNWAVKSKDEQGRPLLEANPLRGLKTPKEKNPTRVVLSDEEYRALLQVSRRVDWRFQVALVLAHETGHRIGAIRQLRWSDIDFEERVVLWRAEHEKTGLRAPDAGHRRGARRLGRGTANQPWERGRAGPARALGSLDELQPRAGLCLVEQGRAARGTEAHARKRLALAQAEVCLRSHGPAAQGALRTRRLEGGPDRAPVLPAGRRGTTQEGSGEPPQGSRLIQSAGVKQRESGPGMPVSSITPIRYQNCQLCRLGLPYPLR